MTIRVSYPDDNPLDLCPMGPRYPWFFPNKNQANEVPSGGD